MVQRSSNCSPKDRFGEGSSEILSGEDEIKVDCIRDTVQGLLKVAFGGLLGCEYRLGEYCTASRWRSTADGALSTVGWYC